MKKTLLLFFMLLGSLAAGAQTLRGDVNGDGIVDVADITEIVDIILHGEAAGGDEEENIVETFPSWTSTNTSHDSTSQNSYTLNVTEGNVLTFDWEVSCESNWDWLIVTLDGQEILKKSGVASGSYRHTFTATGTHTLLVKYTKDGSQSSGSDQAKIYNITLHPAGALPEEPTTPTGEAVDLGLSVKWASCNVGATAPEEYGSYYAWGETEEKSDYSWGTYKYCNGSEYTMTKYCTDSSFGTVDGKTILEAEDDVATVKWGGTWRMPTRAEQNELIINCTWQWTTLNGIKGYRVTGPNGNSIFLPAAGYRGATVANYQGAFGYYWSSTLDKNGNFLAWYSNFYSYDYEWISYHDRYNGHTVRPVCK